MACLSLSFLLFQEFHHGDYFMTYTALIGQRTFLFGCCFYFGLRLLNIEKLLKILLHGRYLKVALNLKIVKSMSLYEPLGLFKGVLDL